MMRFVLAGLAWLICVGGVALYMDFRDAHRAAGNRLGEVAPKAAATSYDLELTLTFEAQPDPYVLVTDGSTTTPVISVELNGTPVVELPTGIAPGSPWTKQAIEGVVEGSNELLVEAAPPLSGEPSRHALRMRVLAQGNTVADQTFWSEGGEKIVGVLPFTARDKENGHAH